jgi:hypothetical protein
MPEKRKDTPSSVSFARSPLNNYPLPVEMSGPGLVVACPNELGNRSALNRIVLARSCRTGLPSLSSCRC